MLKVLYNGITGQVGKALHALTAEDQHIEWKGIDSSVCNLTDKSAIESAFTSYKPDIFIQIAAYTAVDKAESEQELAFQINAESTKTLANLCKASGATLIYISSDYVYNSFTDRPLKETDPCKPQGVYARSKYEGEQAIRLILDNHIILRTSWVYDQHGHNFVNTMLRLGKDRDELTIVSDQYGAPTYAPDIAQTLATIVKSLNSDSAFSQYGTYNFSNSGVTHWADFAREIFALRNIPCVVKEQTTEEFGAAAPRPKWSVLSHQKLNDTFGIVPRTWKECLRECLNEVK